MSASSVIEGRCAVCDGMLERRECDGWCRVCNVGWAYRSTGPCSGTLSMTIEPSPTGGDRGVSAQSAIDEQETR